MPLQGLPAGKRHARLGWFPTPSPRVNSFQFRIPKFSTTLSRLQTHAHEFFRNLGVEGLYRATGILDEGLLNSYTFQRGADGLVHRVNNGRAVLAGARNAPPNVRKLKSIPLLPIGSETSGAEAMRSQR